MKKILSTILLMFFVLYNFQIGTIYADYKTTLDTTKDESIESIDSTKKVIDNFKVLLLTIFSHKVYKI